MVKSVKYALRNLLTFSGRDNRPTFWWYFLAVYLLTVAISMVVAVPMTIGMIADGVSAAQATGGSEAAEAAMQDSMARFMRTTIWLSVITSLLMMLLIATSFVRRLHDAGLTGWIALVPAAINVVMMARMPGQVDTMLAAMKAGAKSPLTASFGTVPGSELQMLLGWLPTLMVVGLALLPSSDGANRFGEEPDDLD